MTILTPVSSTLLQGNDSRTFSMLIVKNRRALSPTPLESRTSWLGVRRDHSRSVRMLREVSLFFRHTDKRRVRVAIIRRAAEKASASSVNLTFFGDCGPPFGMSVATKAALA